MKPRIGSIVRIVPNSIAGGLYCEYAIVLPYDNSNLPRAECAFHDIHDVTKRWPADFGWLERFAEVVA